MIFFDHLLIASALSAAIAAIVCRLIPQRVNLVVHSDEGDE